MIMKFFTSLDEMAYEGNLKGVRRHITHNKDVNKPAASEGKRHRHALHAAAIMGHGEVVAALLEGGAHVNARDDNGEIALHYVAQTPFVPIADMLLLKGADHTLRDAWGNMPIHVALRHTQAQMAERLRRHGLETLLHFVFWDGGGWKAYAEPAARILGFELGEGSAYCSITTEGGGHYIVDFRQQLQINVESLFGRSIAWRAPCGESWNYPVRPFQGFHRGAEDGRHMHPYAPLLQELRARGVAMAPSLSSAPPRPFPMQRAPQGALVIGSRVQPCPWEGWGTGLAWWANFAGGLPSTDQDALLDLFFHPESGLGLTYVRYNIGGGFEPDVDTQFASSPACFLALPGFKPTADGPYDWTADSRQRSILLGAKQRGANLFEAVSYSPPPWMTVTGSVAGSSEQKEDNLNPAFHRAFAEYLVEVVREYRDNPKWSIDFSYLSPFNESVEGWWLKGGRQEGCNFCPASIDRLLPIVAESLREKGLHTQVAMADSWLQYTPDLVRSLSPAALASVDHFCVHSYYAVERELDTKPGSRADMRQLAEQLGKRVWQTEYGPLGIEASSEMEVALEIGRCILLDVNQMGVSAWAYWQALEQTNGGFWGLINAPYTYDQPFTYQITKQYYILMHFSKWIRPGSHIFAMEDRHRQTVVAALDSKECRVIIVAANPKEEEVALTIHLTDLSCFESPILAAVYRTSEVENHELLEPWVVDFPSDLHVVLPRRSLTTFVLNGLVHSWL